MKTTPVIHKVKDNSYKNIFAEPELFVEFLECFIHIDILKGVTPKDIEDISERFIPLYEDNKDSDTIKRINLPSNEPLFVIGILEHESEVNYIASFKMLQYIVLVLDNYAKENDKRHSQEITEYGSSNIILSKAKGFKFPPVLPIIFYDGVSKWTSEINFADKTELSEVFYKYIPKFEYELVDLNDYTKESLIEFDNLLSLVLLVDKIRKADDIEILSKIPKDYLENLAKNIPEHLLKLLSDVITLFLTKIEVPKNDIEIITENLYKRRFNEMFTVVDNFWGEVREEGRQEGRQEGMKEGVASMIKRMLQRGKSIGDISVDIGMSIEEIEALTL
jgi:predicted transposase/invertase (TIGR01784 family)